jgi:DhnA family fructose-bisphosphate aldolase class Ia
MDSARAVLQARTSMPAAAAWCSGNIWQSPDPAKMVRALRHLIHDDGKSMRPPSFALRPWPTTG